MVDYQSYAPGVYIEESTASGPIAGVGTSTAALIGTTASLAAGLTPGQPVPVTNWTQYTGYFGGYQAGLTLPHAVRGFFLNGGTSAYVVPIADATGLPGALDQLTRLRDVSLVAVPGLVDAAAQGTVIAHCETMTDRFAILDGAPDPTPLKPDGALQKQRAALVQPAHNGYGAIYWPWLVVSDPLAPAASPGTVAVPPSGHLAGVMARSDAQRGVHKAPANEPVRGALDVGYPLNDTEQGRLNVLDINAIRSFAGGSPLVWGARTLSDNTAWRYVNVRRLVIYIETSILRGVRWAVFEPNNTALWKGLERSVTEFLTRVWESGGLFGRTAGEAFYVKVDEELNPPAVRDLGQVIVEIGVAPTRPAEFVVVRLGLWAGGAQRSEG
jgi:phage tail sheath protein FI